MAYCTNTEVKTYLGIDGTDDDTLLTTLITRAQAAIDTWTGRTFEASGDTTRNFDAIADVDGQTLFFDEDLAAITTVTNGDSDSTVITSAQYVTEPRNDTPYYAITILDSTNLAWEFDTDQQDAISIAGKWAYSESAPTDIAHACILLTAWIYKRRDTIETSAGGFSADGVVIFPSQLPRDVVELLAPYRRLVR